MAEKPNDQDTIQRFVFEKHNVRGMIINLKASYKAAWQHHPYTMPVRKFLGKALGAVGLLASTIKFNGGLSLQFQGDGPLSLLLVQSNEQLHLRGLALTDGEAPDDFATAVGKGCLLIHIDPADAKERYQAVTELKSEGIAASIEHYFEQSEQLPTRLWLFADEHYVSGLLLQEMPGEKEESKLFWEHVETLADTITKDEMLGLSNIDILHRLFHEEDIRLFESNPVCFKCKCSIEKMEKAIAQFGQEEAEDLLKEENKISVTCEFCNRTYEFDAVDVASIFAEGAKIVAPDKKQ